MRPTSLFIIAGLIVGAVVLDQPAQAQAQIMRAAETMAQPRSSVAMPLFVGAGLIGMAIGAALALFAPGAQPTELAALPAHRPDRPSPDRDFPDAETIAALFADPTELTNSAHLHA